MLKKIVGSNKRGRKWSDHSSFPASFSALLSYNWVYFNLSDHNEVIKTRTKQEE